MGREALDLSACWSLRQDLRRSGSVKGPVRRPRAAPPRRLRSRSGTAGVVHRGRPPTGSGPGLCGLVSGQARSGTRCRLRPGHSRGGSRGFGLGGRVARSRSRSGAHRRRRLRREQSNGRDSERFGRTNRRGLDRRSIQHRWQRGFAAGIGGLRRESRQSSFGWFRHSDPHDAPTGRRRLNPFFRLQAVTQPNTVMKHYCRMRSGSK